MKRTELFCKTNKQDLIGAETISHKLLLRGDFISPLMAGVYSFLPLGWMVIQKIENIVAKHLDNIGAQQIFLPTLQPKCLWQETDRWEKIIPPLFKLKDRHGKEIALGPTHEEVITDLIRRKVNSYKDLPIALYQIQNKFRNEMRATGGLLRTREFVMKDLYSFHASEKELDSFYQSVKKAYDEIFQELELNLLWVKANSGTIGGSVSQEATVLAESGEDKILVCLDCGYAINIEESSLEKKQCPNCSHPLEVKKGIEVGHVFQLGDKYSREMKATYVTSEGQKKFILMGCYGLGITRIMATLVEKHYDQQGIIWPKSVSPFSVYLIGIGEKESSSVRKAVLSLYQQLKKEGIKVLWDDRQEKSAGEKFADADLLGFPYRLLISKKTLLENKAEIKERKSGKVDFIKLNNIIKYLKI